MPYIAAARGVPSEEFKNAFHKELHNQIGASAADDEWVYLIIAHHDVDACAVRTCGAATIPDCNPRI